MSRLYFKAFGIDISLSFWFFAVLTAFFVFGRGPLALYFILPTAIHELGHVITMCVCGIKARAVSFTPFGIEIKRGGAATASYIKDIAVCMGGPAANLLAAAGFYFFAFQSMRAILFISVNAALALFNLMPVGNLDGGQILHLILERSGDIAAAARISGIFSFITLVPLFAASIFLIIRGFANVSLLVACVYLACVVVARE